MRRTLYAVLTLVCLVGCAPLGHKTYLVLGIGVFRVEQTNQVKAVKSNTLGLHAGDGRVNLGASSLLILDVPTNSNTIIDLRK